MRVFACLSAKDRIQRAKVVVRFSWIMRLL